MKKICNNPIKYNFIVTIFYMVLFIVAILNLVNPSFFLNIFFTLFFIVSFFFNSVFLIKAHIAYGDCPKEKLLLLSIICFVVTDIICKIPEHYDLNNYTLVILCSYSAIPFSQTLNFLSLYLEKKHPNIARVIYFFAVLLLLLANTVAIIRLFFPVN